MGKKGNTRQSSRRIRKAQVDQAKAGVLPTVKEIEEEIKLLTVPPPTLPPNGDDVPWNDEIIEEYSPSSDREERGDVNRMVTVIKDHGLEYPELYLEVFIAGDPFEDAAFAEMFARSRCTKAKSLEEADVCVFTGGVDVDPALYGEERHKSTRFDVNRDSADINTFLFCVERGIPMFGVCRGAQFLHVMMGGKLYQDVDNHHTAHPIFDVKAKTTIERASSVHHQMVIAQKGMEIMATANVARNRWKNPKDNQIGMQADIEAFFYREACIFGVQGHPEYAGYNFYTVWCLKQMNELFLLNPDTDWVKEDREGAISRRRIKPDILAQRRHWEVQGVQETLKVGVN